MYKTSRCLKRKVIQDEITKQHNECDNKILSLVLKVCIYVCMYVCMYVWIVYVLNAHVCISYRICVRVEDHNGLLLEWKNDKVF